MAGKEAGETIQGVLIIDPESLKRDRLENDCSRWAGRWKRAWETHDKTIKDGIELVWQCLDGLARGSIGIRTRLDDTRLMYLISLPPTIRAFISNRGDSDLSEYAVKIHAYGDSAYELLFADVDNRKSVKVQFPVVNKARTFSIDTQGNFALGHLIQDQPYKLLVEIVAFLPTLVDHFEPKKEQVS